ncbi:hypothetical protein [Streptomyces sp. NPDC001985]|uniref:hypothetical protein n=1 Tax=Streptomyces sp. NPDC001985 TaxID=3154406 RepID=UPI0033224A52
MRMRLGAIAATVFATAALTLGSASSASASMGFWVHSHHASQAACQAAGEALRPLNGALYLCKPFSGKVGVYELWVRY